MPSPIEHDTLDQRTWVTIPGSFIKVGDDAAAWSWFFPPSPAAPELRRPPMAPGDLRAAMLHAADCLDASLDAQVEGDGAELLRNLETVRGLVAVVLGQLKAPSSSENRMLQ